MKSHTWTKNNLMLLTATLGPNNSVHFPALRLFTGRVSGAVTLALDGPPQRVGKNIELLMQSRTGIIAVGLSELANGNYSITFWRLYAIDAITQAIRLVKNSVTYNLGDFRVAYALPFMVADFRKNSVVREHIGITSLSFDVKFPSASVPTVDKPQLSLTCQPKHKDMLELADSQVKSFSMRVTPTPAVRKTPTAMVFAYHKDRRYVPRIHPKAQNVVLGPAFMSYIKSKYATTVDGVIDIPTRHVWDAYAMSTYNREKTFHYDTETGIGYLFDLYIGSSSYGGGFSLLEAIDDLFNGLFNGVGGFFSNRTGRFYATMDDAERNSDPDVMVVTQQVLNKGFEPNTIDSEGDPVFEGMDTDPAPNDDSIPGFLANIAAGLDPDNEPFNSDGVLIAKTYAETGIGESNCLIGHEHNTLAELKYLIAENTQRMVDLSLKIDTLTQNMKNILVNATWDYAYIIQPFLNSMVQNTLQGFEVSVNVNITTPGYSTCQLMLRGPSTSSEATPYGIPIKDISADTHGVVTTTVTPQVLKENNVGWPLDNGLYEITLKSKKTSNPTYDNPLSLTKFSINNEDDMIFPHNRLVIDLTGPSNGSDGYTVVLSRVLSSYFVVRIDDVVHSDVYANPGNSFIIPPAVVRVMPASGVLHVNSTKVFFTVVESSSPYFAWLETNPMQGIAGTVPFPVYMTSSTLPVTNLTPANKNATAQPILVEGTTNIYMVTAVIDTESSVMLKASTAQGPSTLTILTSASPDKYPTEINQGNPTPSVYFSFLTTIKNICRRWMMRTKER